MANNTLLASDNFASGSALERKRARSREWMRKWRIANREQARMRNRQWMKDHPESVKNYNEKRRGPAHARKRKETKTRSDFGISLVEYERRLALQENLCAICKEAMDDRNLQGGRAPALDHNHENGKLREFVHNDCNRGMGCFRDDPIKLRQAADYLEKHNGQ